MNLAVPGSPNNDNNHLVPILGEPSDSGNISFLSRQSQRFLDWQLIASTTATFIRALHEETDSETPSERFSSELTQRLDRLLDEASKVIKDDEAAHILHNLRQRFREMSQTLEEAKAKLELKAAPYSQSKQLPFHTYLVNGKILEHELDAKFHIQDLEVQVLPFAIVVYAGRVPFSRLTNTNFETLSYDDTPNCLGMVSYNKASALRRFLAIVRTEGSLPLPESDSSDKQQSPPAGRSRSLRSHGRPGAPMQFEQIRETRDHELWHLLFDNLFSVTEEDDGTKEKISEKESGPLYAKLRAKIDSDFQKLIESARNEIIAYRVDEEIDPFVNAMTIAWPNLLNFRIEHYATSVHDSLYDNEAINMSEQEKAEIQEYFKLRLGEQLLAIKEYRLIAHALRENSKDKEALLSSDEVEALLLLTPVDKRDRLLCFLPDGELYGKEWYAKRCADFEDAYLASAALSRAFGYGNNQELLPTAELPAAMLHLSEVLCNARTEGVPKWVDRFAPGLLELLKLPLEAVPLQELKDKAHPLRSHLIATTGVVASEKSWDMLLNDIQRFGVGAYLTDVAQAAYLYYLLNPSEVRLRQLFEALTNELMTTREKGTEVSSDELEPLLEIATALKITLLRGDIPEFIGGVGHDFSSSYEFLSDRNTDAEWISDFERFVPRLPRENLWSFYGNIDFHSIFSVGSNMAGADTLIEIIRNTDPYFHEIALKRLEEMALQGLLSSSQVSKIVQIIAIRSLVEDPAHPSAPVRSSLDKVCREKYTITNVTIGSVQT